MDSSMDDFTDSSDDFCLEETGLSMFSTALRKIIALLETIDATQGHSAAQWGSTRTKGGSPAPAAERLLEAREALDRFPPRLVRIAEALRGYPVKSQRGKYVAGLLKGYSGAGLMQTAKLSRKAMEENRRWLKGIVK